VIELLNMDCMDYMAGLPDKAFELAIVDPPYGIGMDGNNNWSGSKHEKKQWDIGAPDVSYFHELQRVSKNQIVWGANHFIERLAIGSPCWIVWDKKNDGFSFADAELAWTSFATAIRFFRYARGQQTDLRIHPTQKPVALYEWLLTNYAKPGDHILDTHLGSGSSAIAAHNLGFDFVGMELDADYYAFAVKRFEQHKAQASLFDCDDYQRTERDYQQDNLL
jgi:site-specific DNA-methyltransferase (adenine-specific)